jgi:CRISPR/Cas system-associated endoribonuclease Cas2
VEELMTILKAVIIFALVIFMSPVPAVAQAQLTSADIQRLQDSVFDAGADVSRLRQRDARLAESLERELDDLRDEVIYLKVKMRKTGATRAEYTDLRDRIDQLRTQARGDAAPASSSAPPSSSAPRRPVADERLSATEIPVGTEFDVRLQSRLNSGTARVEDRFDTTTVVPYERNGRVLVPAGSVLRGVVNSVTPASRGVNRKGELTLVFDRFSIEGRTYSVRATVMQALQGEADTGRVAAGAGVGAIIGGILGGVRGALTGILIGGGGTVAATEGNEVDLAPGTLLRVRLDSALDVAQ